MIRMLTEDADAAEKIADDVRAACEAKGFHFLVVVGTEDGIGCASDILNEREMIAAFRDVFRPDR
jgi:hypothetical protein